MHALVVWKNQFIKARVCLRPSVAVCPCCICNNCCCKAANCASMLPKVYLVARSSTVTSSNSQFSLQGSSPPDDPRGSVQVQGLPIKSQVSEQRAVYHENGLFEWHLILSQQSYGMERKCQGFPGVKRPKYLHRASSIILECRHLKGSLMRC